MTSLVHLQPRENTELAGQLSDSAHCAEGLYASLGQARAWISEREQARRFRVDPIPFAHLRGWRFESGSGDLVHESGKFFAVRGLHWQDGVDRDERVHHQPIIDQPEVGILGILVKEIGGVLHFLMQAKMEPGNPRPVMLSPTIQATRSNYTQVHKGAQVRYLGYFTGPRRGKVIADVLQSEHGDWFLHKRNRNMIIMVDEPVAVHEDFLWLTLGQLGEFLAEDNMVNMDARTVLACLPPVARTSLTPAPALGDGFGEALAASRDPRAGAMMSTAEILSWFTDVRTYSDLQIARLPLAGLPHWHQDRHEISREDGLHFKVIAVDVQAEGREVGAWTQPLVAPVGRGLSAFLVKEFGGVLHLLIRARSEAGFMDKVEIGPSVQYMSESQRDESCIPFLEQIPRDQHSSRIRYQSIQSEEGGRFLAAEVHYMVVEAEDSVLEHRLPADFTWITVRQLSELLRHSLYANVQARTLMACLNCVV